MNWIVTWLYINTPLYYPLTAWRMYKVKKLIARIEEVDMRTESLTLQNEFAAARGKHLQKQIRHLRGY
jgi:hypothetical protein